MTIAMKTNNDLSPALICVDWGSTNFRAFLLDSKGELLDQVNSAQGMLTLRQEQFEATLMEQIARWLATGPLPVLMAGMVGSQRGWCDAGYVSCPVNLSGLTQNLCRVPNAADLPLAIVPGIKGQSLFDQPDVMRGEEVQIFGALSLLQQMTTELPEQRLPERALICLPGTHSKWARIDSTNPDMPRVLDFSTQMTGELFSLLNKHSILGRGAATETTAPEVNAELFDQGVSRAQGNGGMLHHLFSARTHLLAGDLSSAHVGSFLSGLLVGTEIKEMLKALPETQVVYLVGNEKLNKLYRHTLERAGIRVHCISGDQAAHVGMLTIAKQTNLLHCEDD